MGFWDDVARESSYSIASGHDLPYVVLQVTLKEKSFGTGSVIWTRWKPSSTVRSKKGYRLHAISTSNGGSKGFGGGDRIQATLVFEKLRACGWFAIWSVSNDRPFSC